MKSIFYWKEILPADWNVVPLKAVASYVVSSVDKVFKEEEIPVELCNYTDVYKNDFITNVLEFMKGSATEEEILKYQLEIGDVIITKDSESWDDIAIPALVKETKINLVCGYHLSIIKPDRNKILPSYLFYCLQSKDIRIQLELVSTGVTRYGLSKDDIGRASLPIPHIDLQRKICRFLDIELTEINKLIDAKNSLLKILSEKRQSIITQVFTKGLDANVLMEESGIYWIDEIPEGWKIKKIKYLTTKVGSGITPKGGATVYLKAGIPLLRSQNIQFNGLDLKDVAYISEEIHESMGNSKVYAGDVLLNITGASIGRCYYYNGELGEANVNQHVCILRPNEHILTGYLNLLLSSKIGQRQVELHQVGGGREGLTFDIIKSFIFPVPDIQEQRQILNYVQDFNDRIFLLEIATKQSMDILKERRATLITAAVTGQLEIPS